MGSLAEHQLKEKPTTFPKKKEKNEKRNEKNEKFEEKRRAEKKKLAALQMLHASVPKCPNMNPLLPSIRINDKK